MINANASTPHASAHIRTKNAEWFCAAMQVSSQPASQRIGRKDRVRAPWQTLVPGSIKSRQQPHSHTQRPAAPPRYHHHQNERFQVSVVVRNPLSSRHHHACTRIIYICMSMISAILIRARIHHMRDNIVLRWRGWCALFCCETIPPARPRTGNRVRRFGRPQNTYYIRTYI